MSNALNQFNYFLEIFKKSKLWLDMKNTREDSPWHREENTAKHTSMLLDWYQNNILHYRNEQQQMMTLVCCCFHDVGKPPAQIIKYSETRGEYRSYANHEQLSSRLWTDYALSNFEQISGILKFDITDISNIAFMIEHHVPFGIEKLAKKKNLKSAIISRVGYNGHQAWLDFLLSDQHGRISDNHAENLANVDTWITDWNLIK